MVFVSDAQTRTCFSRQISAKARGEKWTWDCDEWAEESCKQHRRKECISKLHEGPKGGLYFFVDGVKTYVPRGEKERAYAIKKYGRPIKDGTKTKKVSGKNRSK
jgi:hypothetical protein